MFKLTNKIKKKKNIKQVSYNPEKVNPETYGNKKTSSMSYRRKKTHISKN